MKTLFALLGVTFLFIVLLNIAFAFLLIDYTEKTRYPSGGGESLLSRSIYPNSETGRNLLGKKFGRQEADRIYKASLDSPVPYFAPHPSLHYLSEKYQRDVASKSGSARTGPASDQGIPMTKLLPPTGAEAGAAAREGGRRIHKKKTIRSEFDSFIRRINNSRA